MRPRLARLRYELRPERIETRVLDELPHLLPRRWINHLTMGNLGRLVVADPRLHSVEVPTITVDQITGAMKVDEGREDVENAYPRDDGEYVVIGSECFAVLDGSVLSWRGENYVRQSDLFDALAALDEVRRTLQPGDGPKGNAVDLAYWAVERIGDLTAMLNEAQAELDDTGQG